MSSRSNWRVLTMIAVLLLVAGAVRAHQDPPGDVHPLVRVENGDFAIYFQSNLEPREFNQEPTTWRVVYSKTGELLAPRHRVEKYPDDRPNAPLRGWDFAVRAGDEVLMFPPYERLHHGKPYYSTKANGQYQRHRLPWPDGVEITELSRVLADERSITIVAKAGTPVITLYHFSRDGYRLPAIVELGPAARIYDFPTLSNLVFAGGKYWLAWMRGVDKKSEAILSTWKPGDERAEHVVLNGPANWNSNMSMARGGDTICLAYHCGIREIGPSRIFTFFFPVK